MTAVRGKDILLKVDRGDGTYITVAGVRGRSVKIDNEEVDISSSDSSNQWQELLESAGIKKLAITGAGVLKRDVTDTNVLDKMKNGTIANWQIVMPSYRTITGLFQISSHEISGDHNDAGKYSITLASAGEPTFS